MKDFKNCLVKGANQLSIRVDITQAKLMETQKYEHSLNIHEKAYNVVDVHIIQLNPMF